MFAATSTPGPPELLFLVGSDRDARLIFGPEPIPVTGSSDLNLLIDRRTPFHLMHVTKNFFKQAPSRPNLFPFRVALNLVTDPDQSPKVLANIAKLLRGFGGRVLNRPEAVLRSTRDQVARLLAGIPGLIAPKTLRLGSPKPEIANRFLARAQLRYPVLLRRAGTHTGEFIGVFDRPEDVSRSLSATGEHIITEFMNFAGADGLYRKYRVFFIGARPVFRHMLVSDHWNVHARDRTRFMASRPELLNEEESVLASPSAGLSDEAMETLRRVRERMPLDFFGMDFAVAPSGELLLFEANATMNFLPFAEDPRFAYAKKILEPAHQAMHQLIGVPPPIRGFFHEDRFA
jgi:glutathione synthase/RimK-type ligase-like ATP-grasp enzyme